MDGHNQWQYFPTKKPKPSNNFRRQKTPGECFQKIPLLSPLLPYLLAFEGRESGDKDFKEFLVLACGGGGGGGGAVQFNVGLSLLPTTGTTFS